MIVITFINTSLCKLFLSTKNITDSGEINATQSTPVITRSPPTTTVAPIEEIPEPPEVEQHSSMTIFFILLVVGMIFKCMYVYLSEAFGRSYLCTKLIELPIIFSCYFW